VRLFLTYDSRGKLIGTVPSGTQETKTNPPGVPAASGEQSEEVLQVAILPHALPGQTVREVEVPRELEGLSEVELHEALMRYRVKPGEAELVQPESDEWGR